MASNTDSSLSFTMIDEAEPKNTHAEIKNPIEVMQIANMLKNPTAKRNIPSNFK
jgi:hypothetical protein